VWGCWWGWPFANTDAGSAVRSAQREPLLALFGALLGNLLSYGGLVAKIGGLPLLAVEAHLVTNPVAAAQALADSFAPIDILFYAIAIIAGYHYSFRELVESDIVRMVRHSTTEEDDV